MPSKDKSLKNKEASREAVSQLLGFKLVDETAERLLNGEDLSLEQLSKYYSFTEIGTALIRLDAFHTKFTEESCECYFTLLGHKFCYPCTQKPPDED
jgi:hypothetical protein